MAGKGRAANSVAIPRDASAATIAVGGRELRLTNLDKPFFPRVGLEKRDLLAYYAEMGEVILPHLAGRPLVMKRYPDGAEGSHFFMKRTPAARPAWLRTCAVEHASGNTIDFPVVDDLAALLWIVNLGCIDLNPWYCRCSGLNRPDFLNFDLDPPKAERDAFAGVRAVALLLRERLAAQGLVPFVKTSGAAGVHIFVPVDPGPSQKELWTFAKGLAQALERDAPELVTAQYRIANRPPGRVLVDYNQNAWGRTLASAYSVRPTPTATVSTPLFWHELEAGATIDDFHIQNVPKRVAALGDPWQALGRD